MNAVTTGTEAMKPRTANGLVPMNVVLRDAQRRGYGVPAFNVCNLEYVDAVFKAADAMRAPVIISLHPVEIEHGGLEELTSIIRSRAARHPYPVVMHLDHGDTFERAVACIQHGFSSVMFDGSTYPYEENIERTREVVRVAHAAGVDVEGELGLIGGAEGDAYAHVDGLRADDLTDPSQARDFVERTGIDSLAVAIGTAHGFYRGEPHIDLERLAEIRAVVDVPLVLHGGSGNPLEKVQACIRSGVCKINIASEFKRAFHAGLAAEMAASPDQWDPLVLFPAAKASAHELLCQKLEQFGAAGKAAA